ncbi:hypothetical protein ABEY43_07075 [Priestia megaterium]
MKVFIVTSGSYSDYGIDRVFLDEEKAQRYVDLKNTNNQNYRLEEYDTDDDKIIDEIPYVRVSYSKGSEWEEDSLKVEIRKGNTLDDTEKYLNYQNISIYSSGEKEITIERVIKNMDEEEAVINKYTKVAHDLMAEVESLIEIEEWTESMIRNWFNDNVENVISGSETTKDFSRYHQKEEKKRKEREAAKKPKYICAGDMKIELFGAGNTPVSDEKVIELLNKHLNVNLKQKDSE